jgi:hypothetical protein
MIESIGEQRGALKSPARGAKDGIYYLCKPDLHRSEWVVEIQAGLCAQCVMQGAEATQSATPNLFELFRPESPLSFCADYVRETELPVPI